MAETSINAHSNNIAVESFSLKEFLQVCVSKWKWFLLSFIVFLGLGYLYISTSEPVYERSEQILIKNQESGGSIGDLGGGFAALGLFSNNSSVNNELISITSPAITYEVVRILNLDMTYVKTGGMHGVTLYGKTLPFELRLLDAGLQDGMSLKCRLDPDGSVILSDFVKNTPDGKLKFKEEVKVPKFGDKVKTPLGEVMLVGNPDCINKERTEPWNIKVTKLPMQVAVELYSTKVSGDLVDEYAEVIELVIRDVNVERAVDVLNEIVKVYNSNYINDKNKIAKATSAFIDERLGIIEKELGDVDHTIADYQSSLETANLLAEGTVQVEKNAEYEESITLLTNQLYMATYFQEFLDNPKNAFNVLPMNTGVESPELEKQIGVYNEALIARNNLVAQSSTTNPIVQEYDTQLEGMRNALKDGASNQVNRYKVLLESAKREYAKNRKQIKESPVKILPLMAEQRQQKVKENLYLFLLEKREENELTQKFTADNTRIITPPMGSLKPISPKKKLIMIVALFLALGVPLVALYLMETNNTKIRGKRDLQNIKIPFAGEIPLVAKKKSGKRDEVKKFGRNKETAPLAVVEEGNRDVVNEAFRVIRSNIDFMSSKKAGGEVIMLTSFNPGSGKSFISYNLGLSFALKNKRVLLIDCDLRHGSSSMYVNMPGRGITNYLNGSVSDWRKLVIASQANSNLDIMPVGKMPPNPAELLEGESFGRLIEEAKKEYDYILLDCPPVNIVVDAQIVGIYADRTLFIVRAGLLERSALTELNEFYESDKFKKMSLILNGTEAIHSRYYTYGSYQNYTD